MKTLTSVGVFYLYVIMRKSSVIYRIKQSNYKIMLTYFISGSNSYTIRTASNTSTEVTMSLQDMTTLTNSTASLSGITINDYESMLSFTASISGAVDGEEYRAVLYASGSVQPIWNGSLGVFHSQSVDKPVYKTQNDGFISHDTNNEYIIIR